MNNKSIGIFDSGLGGLCALAELQKLLPDEHFVYFGDTGRTPYGTRSEETIHGYAMSDIKFLLSKDVKAILCACGTVSSVVLPTLSDTDVPLLGTIAPSSAEAVKATVNKKIGIMATGATIGTDIFDKTLRSIDPDISTVSVSCPLLIPIVEQGFAGTEISRLAIEHYIAPIIDSGADTVILGCTHFPILASQIAEMYPTLSLIDSGAAAARELYRILISSNLLSDGKNGGTEYYVSDRPNNFAQVARSFLGHDSIDIQKTEIE